MVLKIIKSGDTLYFSYCCIKSSDSNQQLIYSIWVTCSIIAMNTHTVGYFDLVPHTSSRCLKYSLEHQMWVNLYGK